MSSDQLKKKWISRMSLNNADTLYYVETLLKTIYKLTPSQYKIIIRDGEDALLLYYFKNGKKRGYVIYLDKDIPSLRIISENIAGMQQGQKSMYHGFKDEQNKYIMFGYPNEDAWYEALKFVFKKKK